MQSAAQDGPPGIAGGGAQVLLAVGPAVLFVLGGVAAAIGIGRRVGEYR